MWISKVELTNFKSYHFQAFTFPKPAAGKNLVLIGGMNGYGKTTFLEAIYLCLYGKEATSHLARAGLSDDSYGKFLKNALHGTALSSGRDFMSVSISVSIDDENGYEFIRKWYFHKNGSFAEEELSLWEISGGIRSKPLAAEEDDLKRILENYLVPAHLAPFFFFDGEEVKKNADQNQTEFIKMGMENLLGVVHLRGLQDRLTKYSALRSQGVIGVDTEQLQNNVNKLAYDQNQLAETEADYKTLQGEISRLSQAKDGIQQRMLNIGAGGGDVRHIEDLLGEEAAKKTQLNEVKESLSKLLYTKLPFHLASQETLSKLKKQLSAEDILIDWKAKKDALEPQKGKFTNSLDQLITDRKIIITSDSKQHLFDAISEAWEGIYTPLPDGCADELQHYYLDSKQRFKIAEMFEQIKISSDDIQRLLESEDQLVKRIKALENKRVQLQGIMDDGQLQALMNQLNDVDSQLDQSKEKLAATQRKIDAITAEITDLRSIIERLNKSLREFEPQKSYTQKAGRVLEFIEDLLPELFRLKTEEISNSVTEMFKLLTHKNMVASISINELGESALLDEAGNEIKFDLSAGEKQMFATAMIAGLAKTSGFNVPLIVDTPLGRLDSEHREKIINYWISEPNRQVILLSQDEEIGFAEFAKFQNQVSKTYLLETTILGQGVGKTIAHENKYFGPKND
ncbi:TPA: DNA sulfur modification protein DndD [Pseudomonas aeruginosa]|uniref:DNA sulfur modification protein DndD n=1 Tax=Pseudomonas aeruginosa TaxID=287 RepID=UPI000F897467|nr:DNA sulfur modification protein DndD [Pseudomonas aeruginosa]MBI8018062.1 DNA sulfur modification protein DndD [Pseudomonas aeruginosa]MDV2797068.1 DNA sulfur modification protein DndD [Pseudomonas aeruginosa]RUJ39640.1 DNA sulfur modification protein DndD [Pseudomonas aeruginosa]TED70903.1 DNA sulfur modification protein DndD [Pseudomonas aeruginosa]WOU14308.1 DNA sulfur modification protein DndD [Pseudomonas aeruginosa]